jgi:hypothetical protein
LPINVAIPWLGQRGPPVFSLVAAQCCSPPRLRHLLPAAYQVRNFSDALIGSSVASDDRNNLIKQIDFDRVFHARLVLLNQRSSEFIKILEDRAQCASHAARNSLPKEQSTCALRASTSVTIVGNILLCTSHCLASDVISNRRIRDVQRPMCLSTVQLIR